LVGEVVVDGNRWRGGGNLVDPFESKHRQLFGVNAESQFARYGAPDDLSEQRRSGVTCHPPLLSL
jgi:hypothetical protein